MGESAFRSAAPAPTSASMAPVATPGDPQVPAVAHDDSLFYTYEGDHMRPYTAEYFDVTNVWDAEPSLSRDLREIEGYIREQVHAGKLDNTTKAAGQFLKELERKADLTRYESGPQRIQKILGYIDFKRTVES